MEHAISSLVTIASISAVLATLLPFSGSKRWWIRGLDFPRLQLFFILLALIPLTWAFALFWPLPMALLVALCAAYQGARIVPYTPLWPTEVPLVEISSNDAISAMSSNVEMDKNCYEKVAQEIRDTSPDILFLMETDANWNAALSDVLSTYPTIHRELKDNFYGMIFATRLPVPSIEFTYLTDDDIPTLFVTLTGPNGCEFKMIGLHPRPPLPGEDTDYRDAQIHFAAKVSRETTVPVIIMGDFNDTAWSETSRRFKRIGGYFDPRIGRGIFPSFDANSWLVRAPIDQLYLSKDMALESFWRGPNVGSDHFPIHARFSPSPGRGQCKSVTDRSEESAADDDELEPIKDHELSRLKNQV